MGINFYFKNFFHNQFKNIYLKMEIVCFKFLAKILMMHPEKSKSFNHRKELSKEKLQIKTELIDMNDFLISNLNKNLVTFKDPEITENLKSISESLIFITAYLDEIKQGEDLSFKWVFAAKVMDRLFLIISSLYAVFTFSFIILINPNVYHFQ